MYLDYLYLHITHTVLHGITTIYLRPNLPIYITLLSQLMWL